MLLVNDLIPAEYQNYLDPKRVQDRCNSSAPEDTKGFDAVSFIKISFKENCHPQRSYLRNKSLTQSFLMRSGVKNKQKKIT